MNIILRNYIKIKLARQHVYNPFQTIVLKNTYTLNTFEVYSCMFKLDYKIILK